MSSRFSLYLYFFSIQRSRGKIQPKFMNGAGSTGSDQFSAQDNGWGVQSEAGDVQHRYGTAAHHFAPLFSLRRRLVGLAAEAFTLWRHYKRAEN